MSTPSATRARPALALVGGAVAALVLVVGGLLFSGAVSGSAVLDPGALVRWGVPVTTVVADGAAAVTIGALTLCAVVLPHAARSGTDGPGAESRRRGRVLVDGAAWRLSATAAGVAAVVWTLAGVLRIVLSYSRTSGRPLDTPTFGAELAQFVTEIPYGQAHLVATLMVAVLALVCVAVTTPTTAALATVLALASVLPVALTGHAAGAANHNLAVSAMWLHIAAISVWAGGLAVLCLVAGRLGVDRDHAVRRFSTLAGWAFVLVGVSGAVNGWVRVGGLAGLSTDYGVLLLVKVAMFVLLGVAGWQHRRRTVPAVAERPRAFWRLAAGEVVLMGAVIGVSVALGSTAPPVPQDPPSRPSPVQEISGYPTPPEPSLLTWLTQWRPDVLLVVVTAVALGVYLAWVRRLRRRGDAWSLPRTASWVAGWLLFGWVTAGGPAVYGNILFSAHMLQHMLLAMAIPIFLVLGAPITLALRALPSRPDGSRGPREWLLAFVHSRFARFFAHPGVAAVNFAGSMIVFYYSPLFELALSTHVGHLLMVVHFSLAGYMFANVLIGVDPGPQRPRYPLRLILLFATMAFHAFFGIAVMQATTLFAADYFAGLGLPWGVDALADQEAGGAIAWGIGELPTLALAVAVAISWARDEDRTARREDRQADRDDDAALAAYNARLAELAGGRDPR